MKSSCLLVLLAATAASAQWTDCSPETVVTVSDALQSCAKSAGITTQYAALTLVGLLRDPTSATAQAYCKHALPGCADLAIATQKANCSYNLYKGSWVNLHDVVPTLCASVPTTTPTMTPAVTTAPVTVATTAPVTVATTAPVTATTTTSVPATVTVNTTIVTVNTTTTTPFVNPTTPNTTTNVITTPPSRGCTHVSVAGDATYCIAGPICSGDGLLPAGTKCPLQGDVAIASCVRALTSYVDSARCVLPANAICQKIPTGAWGCVLPSTANAGISNSNMTGGSVTATLLTVMALTIPADGCCSTCLAQPLVGAIDALNWTACAATQSVCCFDDVCQSSLFGAPNYNVAQLTYAAGKAQIPSGMWLQLNWPSATNVSYMVLKTGQPKTSQVLNTSLPAIFKDNYFSMCASVVGTLYFRGFAANGCRASQEMAVEIIPGNGTTCSAIPSAPALTSDCDPVRGAVKNGVCECIADKSGPPQCLGNSAVKMAEEYAGIAGAVVFF
ncbi:hypothetical protein SPRG_08264 [Saprolegnia parasitica CBS 223.65]|uniref:Uncharacterized protein n=1 Tax=Saprolegnia parasitica (strain CBS 223.65) TaxID=695850 RepID=A0A067CIS6_SAPPC|nr:hypothetical protein SPRG_08264 [Saprolegnia parasitica CBS 223.65]KDO26461.1 hypothetical protein SPRG_08264 [Saprolegnia parasitica CBS 223.65]|eukprot:XP_012202896.1 hypothetical protein SPRG_08264 [Saprolegnia parasitica CBS 223.65]